LTVYRGSIPCLEDESLLTVGEMKPLFVVFAATLLCVGCGRFLAAIPRHTEIERPVTAHEVAGRWVLTANSLKSLIIDGVIVRKGEEIFITIRSNGAYSSHIIIDRKGARKDEEGRWSLEYTPKAHFKNALVFRTSNAISSLSVALDSQKMILWRSWGDSDEGVDLVYEKLPEK
jgi:hypothetical protein